MLRDQYEQGGYLLVLPVSRQWGGHWTWPTKLVAADVGVGSVLTEEAILVTVSLDTDVCNVVTYSHGRSALICRKEESDSSL